MIVSKYLRIAALASFATPLAFATPVIAGDEVNIYSARQPELIQPLLDAFSAETGMKTNVIFLDKGLEERVALEGENSPVDVILTVDIGRLQGAMECRNYPTRRGRKD